MSKEGAGSKKENESGKGSSGLASTLVLAGGAAGLGFLAHKLWTEWTEWSEEQPHQSTSSGQSKSGEEKDNMVARKEARERDTVHDTDVPNALKCIICMENPREIILMPCGHVCLCEDCAEKVTKSCPVCRGPIRAKKAAYIS